MKVNLVNSTRSAWGLCCWWAPHNRCLRLNLGLCHTWPSPSISSFSILWYSEGNSSEILSGAGKWHQPAWQWDKGRICSVQHNYSACPPVIAHAQRLPSHKPFPPEETMGFQQQTVQDPDLSQEKDLWDFNPHAACSLGRRECRQLPRAQLLMLTSGSFLFTCLANSSVRTRLNPAKARQSKNLSFQQEQFPSESSKR